MQGTLYIAGHCKQSIGSISLRLHCQQLLVIVESPCRLQNIFVWSIVLLWQNRFWRLLQFIKTLFLGCWWVLFFILCEVGVLSDHLLLCQVVLVVIKFLTNSLNSNCCHRCLNSTFGWHLHTSFLNFRAKIVYQTCWWFIQVLVFCLSSHICCHYSSQPRSCDTSIKKIIGIVFNIDFFFLWENIVCYVLFLWLMFQNDQLFCHSCLVYFFTWLTNTCMLLIIVKYILGTFK